MVDKSELIKVRNRDNGSVGYLIPDLGNLHRSFQPGEIKEITMEELRKLSYLPGGKVLLDEVLIIEDNEEARRELVPNAEPEYYYTEKEVEELLRNGTLDQLLDCLDYAPTGVIELVKDIAVKIELNDIQKREAIKKATEFDVTTAIMINKETTESSNTEEEAGHRRAAPINSKESEELKSGRRVSTPPQYKVVNKK